MENLYKRYIEINKQIETLESEKQLIAEKLLPDIQSQPEGKLQLEEGTFSTRTTRKWTYPDYVKEAETVYKDIKKKAETSNDATCEVSISVSFRSKVDEPAF